MAECDSEKAINAFTNERDHIFKSSMIEAIEKATQIDIMVSFIMESGVRELLPHLAKRAAEGIKIRILSSRYLNITSPSALILLKDLLRDKLDLRLFTDEGISFHPKSYIFHYEDDTDIFVGSSNMSSSALSSGVEWNYCLKQSRDAKSAEIFLNTFEDFFNNKSIIADDEVLFSYAKSWQKPTILKQVEDKTETVITYEPRGAQIEALYALNKTREDGFTKALICAATGIGKTYLAAFDSKAYKRVLFVAHRIEILHQAYESFKNVRGGDDDFSYFTSDGKKEIKDVVFASVLTLGQDKNLSEDVFPSDYFDYIVIDEFHHAVNTSYKKILDHFKPKFLLGLTATPERYDGRDIYVLCNYNVPYEISLKQGIERGLLVPFHYYGIYDKVNYSDVTRRNGKYSESELTELYKSAKERTDLILAQYKKHHPKKALGFCCSREHAHDMAKKFSAKGIRSYAVCSQMDDEFALERKEAIEKLEKGEIEVIFSVDMFNEGVDIPTLDMVMFLRPTESPVVFLQQLGRGLRVSEGKEYLTILDFIGNYVNAGRLPELLAGSSKKEEDSEQDDMFACENAAYYPSGCMVDFDLGLIDLFERMRKNSLTKDKYIREALKDEYKRIRNLYSHSLDIMDFFMYVDMDIFLASYKNNEKSLEKKKSIPSYLQDFLSFKAEVGDIEDDEKKLLNTTAHKFLIQIGKLNMDRSYKIPILLAFFNGGKIKRVITKDDVYESYKDFYSKDGNGKDLEANVSTRDYKTWSKAKYISEAKKNPLKMLARSDKFFISREDGDNLLELDPSLDPYLDNIAFIKLFKSMIDIRRTIYYWAKY